MKIKIKYKIFVDMDGVIADFQKGIENIMKGEPHNEYKYETDLKYKKKLWNMVKNYQEDGGELWYELDVLPDAMILWNYIKKYDPIILSATGRTAHEDTAYQKRRWLDDKFGNVPSIFVRDAKDKKQEAEKHHILIDDKLKAIAPWVDAGGIGILHTSAKETIIKLKYLGI